MYDGRFNPAHTSNTCNNRANGHKEETTLGTKMGGSDKDHTESFPKTQKHRFVVHIIHTFRIQVKKTQILYYSKLL